MRFFFFVLVVLISCSKQIVLKENKDLFIVNNYENFSPIQFAESLASLQCEYHHLSFDIIKGNSDDLKDMGAFLEGSSYGWTWFNQNNRKYPSLEQMVNGLCEFYVHHMLPEAEKKDSMLEVPT